MWQGGQAFCRTFGLYSQDACQAPCLPLTSMDQAGGGKNRPPLAVLVFARNALMVAGPPDSHRIVITGIGLTAPNGNSPKEFRESLLAGRSGVTPYEIRYVGATLAGVCRFDEFKYQKKKDVRRGTRAGSVGIYCAHEAIADSGIEDRKSV